MSAATMTAPAVDSVRARPLALLIAALAPFTVRMPASALLVGGALAPSSTSVAILSGIATDHSFPTARRTARVG